MPAISEPFHLTPSGTPLGLLDIVAMARGEHPIVAWVDGDSRGSPTSLHVAERDDPGHWTRQRLARDDVLDLAGDAGPAGAVVVWVRGRALFAAAD
jgi:hypothetical protein